MTRLRLAGTLLAGMTLLAAAAVSALDLPRGALRTVVQACALTHRTLGIALPCLAVDQGGASRPGFAVLRAPDRATHVIVVPLEAIDGIEDPRLQRPAAGAYWRAALSARRSVVEAAAVPVRLSDVGLAINSERTRSQDQLHIHAECVKPDVLASVVGQRSLAAEGHWTRSRRPVAGSLPYLLALTADDLATANLFETLAGLPGGIAGTAGVTALLVEDAAAPGHFILAAQRGAGHSVETYFAHSCSRTRP